MYHDHFEADWEELDQEEAMFRAFALGVDHALGNDHPAEFRRLTSEFHRGLIQIAFDEGESRATEAVEERGIDPDRPDPFAFQPGEYEWDIWEDLITEREAEPDAFEPVQVKRSKLDLPSSLRRPELLERTSESIESITLPRFLLR